MFFHWASEDKCSHNISTSHLDQITNNEILAHGRLEYEVLQIFFVSERSTSVNQITDQCHMVAFCVICLLLFLLAEMADEWIPSELRLS
jgi:hypothetical protein